MRFHQPMTSSRIQPPIRRFENDNDRTVDGFDTSKVIDLKPCYSYTLTIKPNQTDIPGGKVGLTITVDDGVTDEDVTVNIPGDYIPN